MDVKTILNRCHPIQAFIYEAVRFVGQQIHVEIRPRQGSAGRCGECGHKGPTYDTSRRARYFEFIPLWGFAVYLVYCMRRIQCPRCGIKTEQVPWADGKNQCCNVYRLFLARWARRLSWSEVAQIFGTSWNVVCRSIRWVVDYGLTKRPMDNIASIGVDEVCIWRGHKYLTVVYQIDEGMRRLLWVGRERTEATLRGFFTFLGKERTLRIRFVASDMWKPYLDVIKEKASQAMHVLDRFHIVAQLNKAIDEVRAKEARQMKAEGYESGREK